MDNDITNTETINEVKNEEPIVDQQPVEETNIPAPRRLRKKVVIMIVLAIFSITLLIASYFGSKLKKTVISNPSTEISGTMNGSGYQAGQATAVVTPPEDIIGKFLVFNQYNNRLSAKDLIAQNAQVNAFKSTLKDVDDSNSLYDKKFTYQIGKIQNEANGITSYVWVNVIADGKPSVYFFTLSKEKGLWKMVDLNVIKPAGS